MEHATTVETVLGYLVTWEQAAQAMAGAFQDAFSLEFEQTPLTSGEVQTASDLQQKKYAHSSWTQRV